MTGGMLLKSVSTVIHTASKGMKVGAEGMLETGEELPLKVFFELQEGCFNFLTSWHHLGFSIPTLARSIHVHI